MRILSLSDLCLTNSAGDVKQGYILQMEKRCQTIELEDDVALAKNLAFADA